MHEHEPDLVVSQTRSVDFGVYQAGKHAPCQIRTDSVRRARPNRVNQCLRIGEQLLQSDEALVESGRIAAKGPDDPVSPAPEVVDTVHRHTDDGGDRPDRQRESEIPHDFHGAEGGHRVDEVVADPRLALLDLEAIGEEVDHFKRPTVREMKSFPNFTLRVLDRGRRSH